MSEPGRRDLGADRYVAFIETLVFLDVDFGDTPDFALQVRDRKNGGTVRANLTEVEIDPPSAEGLTLVYHGATTVANHVTGGRLDDVGEDNIYAVINPDTGELYDPDDTLTLSQVGVRIAKTTMEDMPLDPDEPEADVVLQWDFIAAIGGGDPRKYAGGDFLVRGGVVQ